MTTTYTNGDNMVQLIYVEASDSTLVVHYRLNDPENYTKRDVVSQFYVDGNQQRRIGNTLVEDNFFAQH